MLMVHRQYYFLTARDIPEMTQVDFKVIQMIGFYISRKSRMHLRFYRNELIFRPLTNRYEAEEEGGFF